MRLLPGLLMGLSLATPVLAEPASTPVGTTTRPTTQAAATSPFDPARHMRVEEVRPGMKGYGLSVLSGTTITRFDVEVISVLEDALGADQSVIMIRCNDEFMQHVGPIAGCSGSPIYLFDESGNARLAGAYAFGWDLARDPIVGVQPIEYMLTLAPAPSPVAAPVAARGGWSLLKSPEFLAHVGLGVPSNATSDVRPDDPKPLTAGPTRLRRLMTPLAVRGMNQTQLDKFAPLLRRSGFEPMLAMGGSADAKAATLEPGSVMAAAMLSGDLDLAAIGTCTEVIDGRAYGFGHPFTGEGATSVPMGAGAINLVMPVLTSSFKLGAVGTVSGAIDMDGSFGVAGQIGAKARTFPIEVELTDKSLGRSQTLKYESAVHPTMSPMIVGMALGSSITRDKELPRDHTITYDVELRFDGDRALRLKGVASSAAGDDVAQVALWPAMLLANNPLQRVQLAGVSLAASIENKADALEILSATPGGAAYKPGETATINVRFKPFQGDAFDQRFEMMIPEDAQDGEYTLSLGDASSHLQSEIASSPHRFAARDIDELFKTLQAVVDESRTDRLYLRLSGADSDMAIGRTRLAKLPPSKRVVLEAAGRPDTTSGSESVVKAIDLGRVVSGSVEVSLRVARKLP